VAGWEWSSLGGVRVGPVPFWGWSGGSGPVLGVSGWVRSRFGGDRVAAPNLIHPHPTWGCPQQGAAPNLIHPHPTSVNVASLSSLTRQDEGHPTKPQPIKTSFIDARKGYNWERLTPQHFILVSLAPNNLKQKRSWRDLMAHTHADRKRLCKRWRYIINRRRHRLQCQETYRKPHYESYTTLDLATSKLISAQILNQRVIVLTPNVITSILTVGSSPDRGMRLNLPIDIFPLRRTDKGYWIFQPPAVYLGDEQMLRILGRGHSVPTVTVLIFV
jgi:hypothetical protein